MTPAKTVSHLLILKTLWMRLKLNLLQVLGGLPMKKLKRNLLRGKKSPLFQSVNKNQNRPAGRKKRPSFTVRLYLEKNWYHPMSQLPLIEAHIRGDHIVIIIAMNHKEVDLDLAVHPLKGININLIIDMIELTADTVVADGVEAEVL